MARSRPIPALARPTLAALVVACLGTAVGPLAHPGPVSAGTAETMEATILSLRVRSRDNRGYVPDFTSAITVCVP